MLGDAPAFHQTWVQTYNTFDYCEHPDTGSIFSNKRSLNDWHINFNKTCTKWVPLIMTQIFTELKYVIIYRTQRHPNNQSWPKWEPAKLPDFRHPIFPTSWILLYISDVTSCDTEHLSVIRCSVYMMYNSGRIRSNSSGRSQPQGTSCQFLCFDLF